MPDTSADITATAAQTRAAGSRIIGFIRGAGGVIVDKLFDVANFITKDAADVFQADGAIRTRYAPGDSRAKMIVSNTVDGTFAAPAYSEIQLRGGGTDADVATISAFNSYVSSSETGLIISLRNASNGFGEVARFTGNGRFGIGTASPQMPVHVSFPDQAYSRVRIQNTGIGGRAFDLVAGINSASQAGFSLFDATNVGNLMVWETTFVRPGGDNSQSLGEASFRWKEVRAVNSGIITCDVRVKLYRGEPTPTADEHAAALECFEVFGFFRHLDAVERENAGGGSARWHFGPKAQEVWTIFASQGLAAPLGEDGLPPEGSVPPAFLCFDTWGEETAPVMAWWRPSDILGPDGEAIMVPCAEGEEGTEQRPTGETYVTREAGNIFGVRIDQLQSLMLVALNKERIAQAAVIADLSDRVAALEPAA